MNPTDDFRTTMTKLKEARKAFLNGRGSKAEMEALAQRAAELYNERAYTVAARMGGKTRPITADRIMRSADMFR